MRCRTQDILREVLVHGSHPKGMFFSPSSSAEVPVTTTGGQTVSADHQEEVRVEEQIILHLQLERESMRIRRWERSRGMLEEEGEERLEWEKKEKEEEVDVGKKVGDEQEMEEDKVEELQEGDNEKEQKPEELLG